MYTSAERVFHLNFRIKPGAESTKTLRYLPHFMFTYFEKMYLHMLQIVFHQGDELFDDVFVYSCCEFFKCVCMCVSVRAEFLVSKNTFFVFGGVIDNHYTEESFCIILCFHYVLYSERFILTTT